MKSTTRRRLTSRLALAALAGVAILSAAVGAQDRLKSMPGYEQYLRMSKELPSAIRMGTLSVSWKDGGRAFEYAKDGKTWRFDIAAKTATELQGAEAAPAAPGGRGGFGGAPERGRQVVSAASPDKTLLAVYRNRNIYITDAAGANEVAVTTDGSEQDRIKYGTASWVYGEELDQTTAMWWSPDGRKLAYYRFDESQVPDYYLQLDQTKLYSRMDIEAYPKSGKPNPLVDLFVYDVAAKTSIRIDVRGGRPFENDVVGHYAYRVSWSPDGRELLFTRANRRQNILEFTAANPDTGVCRTVVREEWPTGWVEASPTQVFLKDGRRFIWASERTGWRNYYLYDLSGTLVTPLTRYTAFEAAGLIKIDEDAKAVFLMARDGDNFLKQQLHRVGLDGKSDVRLTDPAFHHTVGSCMPGGGGRGGGAPGGPGGAGACGISPRMSKEIPSAVRMGNLSVAWKDGGKAFEYTRDGKTWRFDIASKAATELQAGGAVPAVPGGRGGLGGAPERGRQVASAASPDKTLLAVYRNRNIYITDAAGANEVAVTTEGSEQNRIKDGTASWVYGEELAQTTAMWWSPDRPEARLLSVRREPGAGLLPATGSDEALQPDGHRRRTRNPASPTRSWTSSCTTSPRRPASG